MNDSTASVMQVRVLVSLDTEWFQRWGLSFLTYGRELSRVGLDPVRIDFGEVGDAQSLGVLSRRLLDGKSGLMLTGGGDVSPDLYGKPERHAEGVEPVRDALELSLLKLAIERQMPVLGICRGAQIINVGHGGTIVNIQDTSETTRNHKSPILGHRLNVAPDSFLARVLGKTELPRVTSNHSQAVGTVGAGLRASAWADDGVIESVEPIDARDEFRILGLQFHPEAWSTEHQRNIFERFADAASAYV